MGDVAVIKTLVVVAFIGLNFYTYYYLATNPVYPERKTFDEFPLQFDEWRCDERQWMSEKVERNLGVTDYFICRFTTPEDRTGVEVYLGYHASQVREAGGGSGENSIHPPAHCLPGSGWDIISNRTVPLDMPGLPGEHPTAKRVVIAKENARQLVYYWYQSRGRVISQDWKKIVYVALDRALKQRTDGSLVRFTIPVVQNDESRADEAFHDLAPRIMRSLSQFVPE